MMKDAQTGAWQRLSRSEFDGPTQARVWSRLGDTGMVVAGPSAPRELVPEAAHRDDGRWGDRRRVQLHPQSADMDVDCAPAARVAIAPNELGKLVAGQDLIRLTG